MIVKVPRWALGTCAVIYTINGPFKKALPFSLSKDDRDSEWHRFETQKGRLKRPASNIC